MTDTFQSIGQAAASVVAKLAPKIERHKIEGRDQWLAMRRRDCTASTVGALLGVHPYATAYSLWALRSGLIEEDVEDSPVLRRGRLLEPVVVEMLREDCSDWIFGTHPVGFYYRDPAARLGCTPDLLVRDKRGRPGVVQIKSVEPGVFKRKWHDDDGEFAPPLWIACQAIVEAYLTGAEWAAVAAMTVGFGIEIHVVPIPIHAGIIDRIKSEVAAFWRAVEDGKAPDPDYGRDAKLLERLFDPQDGEAVDLSADNRIVNLVDDRARLSAEAKAAEIRLKEIKGELLAKLGGASVGWLKDGRFVVAKRINRKGYSVEPSSYVTVTVRDARP